VRLVINANASGMRGNRPDEVREALSRAGAAVDVRTTSTIAELAELWRAEDDSRIVLAGGDGSLHAAVNLREPPRDVALVPSGGANNIARSLGIPLGLDDAARLAVAGSVQPVDLIEVATAEETRLVVESVSVGYLASARARYHGRNSTDIAAGVRAGAAALARFHPFAAHVRGPGVAEEDLRLAQVFVANLPLYEFGLLVAPHADPADAMLDVIGIHAASRRAVLRMVAELRRGTHLDHADVHLWRTPSLRLATHGLSPIVADSVDMGSGPAELRAVPAALRLVRP
jgi:diacylglycerol kinase family enzyme